MSSSKQIFIDCQILQTDAFNRGMGKYSLSLLGALFESKSFTKEYKPVLILNKSLGQKKENKEALLRVAPKARQLQLDLPTMIAEDVHEKYRAAEATLTQAVSKEGKKGDIYLILSPFVVMFPAIFPQVPGIVKMTVVYDLIPLLVWRKMRIFPDDIYFKHYKLFMEADRLLTISEAVKTNLVQMVGINPSKVTTIDGGPFAPDSSPTKLESDRRKRPYILCVSAPILHKNNERATKAFQAFNKRHKYTYDMVFTSNFDDETQQRLHKLSRHIVFTGNVSDAALSELYDGAACILFASLTEGLGMPVLEGVLHGKPIACSSIPVLNEISKTAFYNFDPVRLPEIARALTDAVAGNAWAEKHKHYPEVIKKYQWSRSANILQKELKQTSARPALKKPTLLIHAPDPRGGTPSGILLEQLYASLSEEFNLSVKWHPAKRHTHPSFVPYIAESDMTVQPDIILELSDSGLLAESSSLPLFRVAVTTPRKRLLVRRGIFGGRSADLHVVARPASLDSALGIDSYVFTDTRGNTVSPASIIDGIKLLHARKKGDV